MCIMAGATGQVFVLPARGDAEVANPTAITIPVLGPTVPAPWPASPYPSTVAVSGQAGVVSDVNLTLHGFDCSSRGPDFAFPEDIDVMLVSPSGTAVVVLSDAGGANGDTALQFSDITVTLDDEAATELPADTLLSSGTYRPVDDDDDPEEQVPTDTFPAPAPAPTASGALSAFDGGEANGTWSLYLVDDWAGPNVCSVLRGWSLQLTTGDGPTTTTMATTTTVAPTTTTMATTTTTGPTTTTTAPPPAGGGTGAWETTASLSVPRYDHTTTLLRGGRVLVAAGRAVLVEGERPELLSSAEVFNPHDERWSPTGSLAEPRWRHTATVLRDGRVLVAGGFGGPYAPGANAQPVLATAEVYDPATGTWSPTGAMATRRALHAAALLPDGRVMVAGGRTCASPPPAACNFTFVTPTIELFDPATGTWSPGGALNAPRHTTSAAVLAD
ncbi:MAG: Kelch repeat-containing protein, partial [Acidimicrobiia bacterium]